MDKAQENTQAPAERPQSGFRKFLHILRLTLTWLLVVLAVGMMVFTIISVTTFGRAERSLFGYHAFVVLSDSMSATDFKAGDLVLSRDVDPAQLKEGDIITFTSRGTDSYGEVITHKIRSITTNADGEPAFVTYGTTTGEDDASLVAYKDVIGQYSTHLSNVGTFFNFLKSTPGYICCILVPFLLLIGFQGVNTVSNFRRYKKEKVSEMQEERRRLEEERSESQRLMAQLQEMQRQLGVQPQSGAPAQPVEQVQPVEQAQTVPQAQPVEQAQPAPQPEADTPQNPPQENAF